MAAVDVGGGVPRPVDGVDDPGEDREREGDLPAPGEDREHHADDHHDDGPQPPEAQLHVRRQVAHAHPRLRRRPPAGRPTGSRALARTDSASSPPPRRSRRAGRRSAGSTPRRSVSRASARGSAGARKSLAGVSSGDFRGRHVAEDPESLVGHGPRARRAHRTGQGAAARCRPGAVPRRPGPRCCRRPPAPRPPAPGRPSRCRTARSLTVPIDVPVPDVTVVRRHGV